MYSNKGTIGTEGAGIPWLNPGDALIFHLTPLHAMVGITPVVATHYSPVVLNNFSYSAVAAIVVPLVDSVIYLLFDSDPISVDSSGATMLHFSESSS